MTIELIWSKMIKERFKECKDKPTIHGLTDDNLNAISYFLEPILNYAREQEDRIEREFKEHAKYFSKKYCTCGMTDLEPCDYCQNKINNQNQKDERDWKYEDDNCENEEYEEHWCEECDPNGNKGD